MLQLFGALSLAVIDNDIAPSFIKYFDIGFIENSSDYTNNYISRTTLSQGNRVRSFSYSAINITHTTFDSLFTLGQDMLSCSGGAIMAYNSDIFIDNSIFKRCKAKIGGSLSTIQSNSFIQQTNFSECESFDIGGAIFCSADTMESSSKFKGLEFTIVKSNFTECSSNFASGALSVHFIEDCLIYLTNFTQCRSSYSGGAIGIFTSKAYIIDSWLIKNQIVSRSNIDYQNKMGISYQKQNSTCNGASIYIKRSTFPTKYYLDSNLKEHSKASSVDTFVPSIAFENCTFQQNKVDPNLNPNGADVSVEGLIPVELSWVKSDTTIEGFIKAQINESVILDSNYNFFGENSIISKTQINKAPEYATTDQTLKFDLDPIMTNTIFPQEAEPGVSPTQTPTKTREPISLDYSKQKTIPVPTLRPITMPRTKEPTRTISATISATFKRSATYTPTISATNTPTITATISATFKRSATNTPTISATNTPTITATISATFKRSATYTPTITATNTPTITRSANFTVTPTQSVSPTLSLSPSLSQTPSISMSNYTFLTLTPSPSPSLSQTWSRSISPSISRTPTPSQSMTMPSGAVISSSWVQTIIKTQSASATLVETEYNTMTGTQVVVEVSSHLSFYSQTRSESIHFTNWSVHSYISEVNRSEIFVTQVASESFSNSLVETMVFMTTYDYVYISMEYTSNVLQVTWVIEEEKDTGNPMSAGLTIGLGVGFGLIAILIAAFLVWIYKTKRAMDEENTIGFSDEDNSDNDFVLHYERNSSSDNILSLQDSPMMDQHFTESVERFLKENDENMPQALEEEYVNILENYESAL